MPTLMRVVTTLHAKLVKATGRLGGGQQDGAVLVLDHVGARSGAARETPLMFVRHGEGYAVAASANGADSHPAWYHNLRATPDVTIHVDQQAIPVRAREAEPQERDEIYARLVAAQPRFAGYETKTDRIIPVMVLDPR
ncbi:nitroreductase/quinone reductase family protein [Serinicoccus kebangsaanensis]|uniref:nitroreductase/quinone reductase family protein n=1 Tax=Serinicoccus kebangsaanensis TaxID=2602069 RepID=UPI00124E5AAC|nr:nitroreductase/quinone reductase family protein [Serinicoccus kebangsaanensis]